ncbi:MAG: PepSY domain-containing protein [Muribaculaceae bacterium]|nr:PepSY domain-containing protein [Muribaculaceae bacterium]
MKLFRKLHLWLSVPFGIIITLICFSGAMLIFEPEITRSVKSDVYYVSSSDGQLLPMAELMETVKATLPDSVEIKGVTVFSDKNRTYQVNLSKPRRASLFIDQYSGQITGKYERIGFFSTMFKLHRWLLDSANPHGEGVKVGKLIVGISTLIFVIALITGVIIWWPRARKNFRRSISISFRDGWRDFWKGLHVAGGMYALIFVLAMSLTGLTWSFNWYRSAFYAVCGVEYTPRNFEGSGNEKSSENRHGKEGRERGDRERHGHDNNRRAHHGEYGERRGGGRRHHSEFGRWQQVYNELRAQNPEAPQITVGAETASVSLGVTGNGRASDKYEFNRRSGEITPISKYADSEGADKLRGWIYAIHTGSWGGLLTRILWFLSALLGASLPLTGYYIWIKHLGKKKHHKPIATQN